MKVNTDGVLLGACSTITVSDRHILDVGTGTGCIALMLAQRYADMENQEFEITGIDIDADSAEEAGENFARSPWSNHLISQNIALQDYCHREKFDLIVSNPPYFKNDLRAPELRRDMSRHSDESLSYENLLDFAAHHLSDTGGLSVILPAEDELPLLRCGAASYLYASKILRIRTTAAKNWSRVIVEMGRIRCNPEVGTLTLQENGRYTDEYISRVSDFYLFA